MFIAWNLGLTGRAVTQNMEVAQKNLSFCRRPLKHFATDICKTFSNMTNTGKDQLLSQAG